MKKYLLPFILGWWLSLPLITFISGYRVGQKQVTVIYQPDAVRNLIKQEMSIGQPESSQAAQIVDNLTAGVLGSTDSYQSVSTVNNTNNLLSAINIYRQDHELPEFIKDELLCGYVQTRLAQLEQKHSLDNHEGFRSMMDEILKTKGYSKISENLGQGFSSVPQILLAWDGSLAHKSILQNRESDYACADLAGSYAVLITGRK